MPLATVMHHHFSLLLPLILRPFSRLWSRSSFRLMRCQKLHLQRKSSTPTDRCRQSCCSLSKWSELLLCDIFDPGEGWVLSAPPEGAYKYIHYDCWFQWDMNISVFITSSSIVEEIVSCTGGSGQVIRRVCGMFWIQPTQSNWSDNAGWLCLCGLLYTTGKFFSSVHNENIDKKKDTPGELRLRFTCKC